MGKSEPPQLPIHSNQQHDPNHVGSSCFFVMGFARRITRVCSFKCVFVLLLNVSVLLTALFSIFHFHNTHFGFDAKPSIKNSATIQGYFRLQKPVSDLLPHITRLEYDIFTEIGVPNTKVAILSLHKAHASNWTHVVFGVLSNPMTSTINPVSLSVLKSSLLELFNQRSNLTLTTSILGQPSSFDLLKFPGGITVIPKKFASIWMLQQALFNFTLPNSVREIEENFVKLKEQLKSGLHLKPYERIYMQVTNKAGSTRDAPVTVQASILSDLGNLVPLRLKQLAQTITRSPPARNLGLDNAVFGKVKEISLSSYLYHNLDAPTPTPSPAPSPSPVLNEYAEPTISPSPDPSPQLPTPLPHAPPPSFDRSCGGFTIFPTPPPMYVPPHHLNSPPPTYQKAVMPPDLPPLPVVSYGSRPNQEKGDSTPPPVSVSPLLSSSAAGLLNHITWILLFFFTLVTLQTL